MRKLSDEPPKSVFADTAFFVATINARDSLHAAAMAWAGKRQIAIVTSEYVLIEFANFMARSAQRPLVAALFESRANHAFTLVPASRSILREATALYARHEDKAWSLTDCTSMVVMRKRGLAAVLTADRHFAQAGFKTLLG